VFGNFLWFYIIWLQPPLAKHGMEEMEVTKEALVMINFHFFDLNYSMVTTRPTI
jgi:hypothetical protein